MSHLRTALLILLLATGLAPGHPTRAWASDSAAEDAAEEAAKAAEDAAEEAARAAEDAAEEAAKAAEDAAEEAAKAAEDAAEEAAKAAEDAAEDAATAAEDAAEDAAKAAEDSAEDAATEAEDAAEDAAKEAEDAAEDAAKAAEDSAEDAAKEAEDSAEDAAKDAEDAADEAADDAEDAGDEAEDTDEDLQDDDSGSGSSGSDDDDDGDDDNSGSGGSGGKDGKGGGDRPQRGTAEQATRAATGVEAFAGGLDPEGNEIALGEWLVIATPDEVHALERLGYLTRSLETLQGLDRVVARMEAPPSFDLEAAQAAIQRAAPGAEADFNHLYRTESAPAPAAPVGGEPPQALYPELAGQDGAGLRIGVIDTAVDLQHPAFAAARVQARDFVTYSGERPQAHGTAVASILVGQSPQQRGLLPQAELFLASVFFETAQGATTATTLGLVRALDWMALNDVPVVNMSLAGPPNGILQSAIARSRELGIVVVAAVGNRGPAAAPLYPAAYPEVVAVTAVDAKRRVYRLANRGEQVDFAAPGVGVRHAAAGRADYTSSSGTSMAAPFVAAVIGASCTVPASRPSCLLRLRAAAEDIGAPGFDTLYGFGLIRPLRS